jgi:uncharacterized protein (DUF1778 family)
MTGETVSLRIDAEVSSDTLELITSAAALRGLDIANFAVAVLAVEAARIVEHTQRTVLAPGDMDAFFVAMDKPPSPTRALRRAFKRYHATMKSSLGKA